MTAYADTAELAAAFRRDGVVCVRHAPRRWPTSPLFEGLDRELPEGAGMDHPLFPVVWPVQCDVHPPSTGRTAPVM